MRLNRRPPVALIAGRFFLAQDHIDNRIRYRVSYSQYTMIVGIAQPQKPAVVSGSDPENPAAEADCRVRIQDRKRRLSRPYGVKCH